MKKILVPIDFSAHAINALGFAIEVAKKTEAELILLHAVPIPFTPGKQTFEHYKESKDTYEKNAREQMAKLPNELPALDEVEYSSILRLGSVPDAIIGCANSREVDMIVLGTKGRRAKEMRGSILQNITTSIIKLARCPVLAIPDKATFRPIKKIALAYDNGPISHMERLTGLREIANMFGAKLNVVMVMHNMAELEEGWENPENAQELDAFLKEVEHTFHFKVKGDTETGINDFLEDKDIDLLAVIPHEHSLLQLQWHSGLTNKLALDCELPLLSIHD